jgi:3-hydroxymyristoyl/3-hydroxydecanoyl-(acyl carrier protein) dehydratase
MTFTIEDALPSCVSAVDIAPAPDGRKEITAECLFPATFPGFQGHFPKRPLLPGIIQLVSVRNIVEQATGRNLTVKRYTGTKFKLPIEPGQQISVQITIEPSPHAIQGKFKIRSTAKKIISSGSFSFSLQEE